MARWRVPKRQQRVLTGGNREMLRAMLETFVTWSVMSHFVLTAVAKLIGALS